MIFDILEFLILSFFLVILVLSACYWTLVFIDILRG